MPAAKIGELKKFARITGVEIARPGVWNGIPVSREMLASLIENYNPANLTATITLGHPRNDDDALPAEGIVSRVYWQDERMCADFEDVSFWAADGIESSAWVYPSIVVDPEWKQLYNVGLLGAATPGIEGLKRLKEAYIEFSGNQNAQVIACKTEETMPEDNKPDPKPEPNPMIAFALDMLGKLGFKVKRADGNEIVIDDAGDREREEFKRKLEASEAENKRLKAEREAEASKTRFAQALAKVDALIGESKLTPAVKDAGLVEVFAALMADDRKLKFAASDGAEHESTVAEMLEASLSALTPHELKKKFSEEAPPEPPSNNEERAAAFDAARLAFKKEHKRDPNEAELQEITRAIFTPQGGK